MKLKELLYALGIKPKTREYPFSVESFVLEKEGEVSFARWSHPKERRKEFSQAAIDAILTNPLTADQLKVLREYRQAHADAATSDKGKA